MSLSPARVLRASADWQWIPDGAKALDIHGVRVIDYPDWARMGFYAMPEQIHEPAAAVISAMRASATERGKDEIDWWISPSIDPPSFEQALVAAGADIAERTQIVAMDISEEPAALELNPDVDCRAVSDAATLDDAERVTAAVWGGEPSAGERRSQQLTEIGDPLDASGGFRVVAYLDGRPVATGGCQVVADVARLYGAGTVADARGRGAYRATVSTRLEIARQHGARLALVRARVDTSLPILTRIGFESFGEARLYKLRA